MVQRGCMIWYNLKLASTMTWTRREHNIQHDYQAIYNFPLTIPSVLAHCEPNHRYTPLVEVNQADVVDQMDKFTPKSTRFESWHDNNLWTWHPSTCVTTVQRVCLISRDKFRWRWCRDIIQWFECLIIELKQQNWQVVITRRFFAWFLILVLLVGVFRGKHDLLKDSIFFKPNITKNLTESGAWNYSSIH